jgi:sugar/nucleoside kinase (ribokinase family)
LKQLDILAVGNLCGELLAWVDRFPGAGDGIHAQRTLWTGGGMAGNLAHAAARLGARVAMVSALGDDFIGDTVVTQLCDAGVNTDYVLRRTGMSSPLTVIMIDLERRRAGLVAHTETYVTLQSDEIPDALISRASVYFTDLVPAPATIEVAERCRRMGVPVAFDMQMAPQHMNWPNHAENVSRMFALTDYFFADEENLILWRGKPTRDAALADALRERPTCTFIITSGLAGSLIATRSDRIEIPAFPLEQVDSIGAGDCYHGAFLYALFGLHTSLRPAGLLASAAAALSCRAAGARNGLPTIEETRTFLEEHNVKIGAVT